jgi:hypothetical protein
MEDEPGTPPPYVSQTCEFIDKDDDDDRVFKKGERVCVRGGKGGKEEVMATVVNATPYIVNVFLDTDFPSKLAKGIDRTKDKDKDYPLGFMRFTVGKMLAPENPGPENDDPAGGRRRRRKGTRRRQRRRRMTRRR